MKYRILTALLLAILATPVLGQPSIDRILVEIERNNKTILAAKAYMEAKKLEYQMGLTPADPTIVYDVLYGSPADLGNQREFSISQSFNFPTVYITKIRRSKAYLTLSDYEQGVLRQSVLLEAKKTLIEWIYRTKLDSLLNDRTSDRKALVTFLQKSIDGGEGSRLALNKTRLMLLDDEAAYHENASLLRQLELKMKQLNGGLPVSLSGVWYEPRAPLPELDTVLEVYRSSDITMHYLKKEREISDLEVNLAKSLALPNIEVGYLDHSALDQRFKGLHFGVSIPVWENKNAIKTKKAERIYRDLALQTYEMEQQTELRQQFDQLVLLRNTLEDYYQVFVTTNHRELLKKSLDFGNTSVIEYLSELDVYYESMIRYLEVEKNYQEALAEWSKYKL